MAGKKAVMIDLETLGTGPDAVIIQVGAVAFINEPGGKVFQQGAFNQFLKPEEQQNRSVTAGTLGWWLCQSQEARDRINFGLEESVPLDQFFSGLDDWVAWKNVEEIWANGTTFDITNLQTLYAGQGKRLPWDYSAGFRKIRDMRGAVDAANLINNDPSFTVHDRVNAAHHIELEGMEAHDAVDDCIYQSWIVQQTTEIFEKAKIVRV